MIKFLSLVCSFPKKDLGSNLAEANDLMDSLLDDKVITNLVPPKGRPVRLVVDDEAWEKELGSTKRKAEKQKKKMARKKFKVAPEDESKEWEVEYIVDKKLKKGLIRYQIKWKDSDQLTWEPITGLGNALVAVNEYEVQHF